MEAMEQSKAESNADFIEVVQTFISQLNNNTGLKLSLENTNLAKEKNNSIVFSLVEGKHSQLGEEGCEIEISKKAISANALNPTGLYYATQTIIQLISIGQFIFYALCRFQSVVIFNSVSKLQ